ncbi:MAG: extracellular solute-binding protein [Chloroflexi bacterium]|nr:extracellular solute-binding protein [Chloroflexota bacterium]
MNKQVCCLLAILAGTIYALAACTPAAAPSPEARDTPASVSGAVPPTWQQEWEKTLAAAKKEGQVTVLTNFGGDASRLVATTVKEKLGLDVDFIVATGGELLAKVQKERAAGLYLEDLYLAGVAELILFKKEGILEPVKPLVFLPEALEPSAWMGGGVYYIDPDNQMQAYIARVVVPLFVNTDLVKTGDIKSYKDLLNPRWKNQLVFFDPTIPGHGPINFMIFHEFMGPDFTRDLMKQEFVITRDARLQTEWIARGKYAISGVMGGEIQAEFVRAGAPIKGVVPAEGTYTSGGKGLIGVPGKSPHPNAGKALVNWILTREGQTLMSKALGVASRRLDVTHEFVSDPSVVPQQGVKYVNSDSEEMIQKRLDMMKIARETWNIK